MGIFKDPKTGLIVMMWLTIFFFFVEIVVGYMTNSMALVADSFHMLGDVAALVISFLSVKMSPKKWSKNTFGWARAEVLGALVNAVFLVALCFSITIEACKRFIEEEPIHNPKLLVIVGGIGLLVNVIGLVLLYEHGGGHHGHSHGISSNTHKKLAQHTNSTDDNENNSFMDDNKKAKPTKKASSGHGHGHSHGGSDSTQMNMRGVYLHVLSDALGSVIVIISALVVWLTDWKYKFYMDPALSILLVVLMLRSVWPLLRESALILLQTVPTHIEVDAIQQRLLEKVDGVLAVHEFHVWQLAGDRIIASAHIRCRNLSEYMKIAEKVKEFFHNEGIHSTTIQPEFVELELHSVTDGISTTLNISGSQDCCALDCPTTEEGCIKATCCQNNNKNPAMSPTASPFLCRQRTVSSRQNSDIESGSLLTAAAGPPSPDVPLAQTIALTAPNGPSNGTADATQLPPAILTSTSETVTQPATISTTSIVTSATLPLTNLPNSTTSIAAAAKLPTIPTTTTLPDTTTISNAVV